LYLRELFFPQRVEDLRSSEMKMKNRSKRLIRKKVEERRKRRTRRELTRRKERQIKGRRRTRKKGLRKEV
jgi:hypothetical protein